MNRMIVAALTAAMCFFAGSALADEPLALNFVTGGASGVYYPLGGAIAQVVTQKTEKAATPLVLHAQASGASKENCELLNVGRAGLAIAQNDTADAAFNGKDLFPGKLGKLRAIARLYPEYLHVVARADGNVRSLRDFQGKRVGVGARASGNETNSRVIFKLFGLSYGTNTQQNKITPIFLPYGETAEQFKNDKIDGFIFTIGTPNPGVQELISSGKGRFVPIDGGDADRIASAYPYLVKDAIPAGTYAGQEGNLPSLSVQAILITHEDVPEEAVYLLTKTLFENLRDVAKIHPKGAEIALSRAAQGVTIPFHPGAERYLKEKGVLK